MSKIFYDHLVEFRRLEIHVNSVSSSNEEKNELWEIIDKLVHNRLIKKIIEILPHHHHEEFAELLHSRPFDKGILDFIEESSSQDIENYLLQEIDKLETEILKELQEDEQEL